MQAYSARCDGAGPEERCGAEHLEGRAKKLGNGQVDGREPKEAT
jgi:hypothetical protein